MNLLTEKALLLMEADNKQKHQFPKTRYQGSKYKLTEWIGTTLSEIEYETVLDAFSGSGSVSYKFKQADKKVFSNDILQSNFITSQALIANNNETISKEDLIFVLTKHSGFPYKYNITSTFEDIYYLPEENTWLDIVIQNINCIQNHYKKCILMWALFQSCLSKRPYNLFHRKNLYVRTANVERTFGNKATWDKHFSEHFIKFIAEANASIFSNKKEHISFNDDIMTLNLPQKPDLVYLDPPYISSKGVATHYRDFYHFLEGICNYDNWLNLIDNNTKNRALYKKPSVWEDKKKIKEAFGDMLTKFKDSNIVVSYRSDGIPSIEELKEQLNYLGKKVEIHQISYQYALAEKKTQEILLVAK